MSNDRLKYLLEQFATDASTPEEVRELFGWIRRSNNDALLKEKIKELWDARESEKELPEADWNAIYTKIIHAPVITKKRIWWQYAAAAMIILSVSTAAYLWFNKSPDHPVVQRKTPVQDNILPGGDKAVLTLADGTEVLLDSAGTGFLSQQGNVKVTKLNNGQLSYQFTNNSGMPQSKNEVLYNTIATPRGGQYQIVLADGTKVWLNAASSLRFPAAFVGNTREVALTGEGYFEVAHNKEKPFRVSVNGVVVNVLGTHFNVSAYPDDASVKTTLLEGSVGVEKNGVRKMISPGEQARIENKSNSEDPNISVQRVDVEDVVAWKNGRFIFHDDNIQSVMKQLARWYDVTVSYEGDITNEEFIGVISRSKYENISEILGMLEKTHTISFAVSGRHVTVMPYVKEVRN